MPKWPIIRVMEKPRTHHDLIKALGGPSDLARDLGIFRPIPTTVHWPRRGIPSRYWHRITELAGAKGITITPRELETLPTSEAA